MTPFGPGPPPAFSRMRLPRMRLRMRNPHEILSVAGLDRKHKLLWRDSRVLHTIGMGEPGSLDSPWGLGNVDPKETNQWIGVLSYVFEARPGSPWPWHVCFFRLARLKISARARRSPSSTR